MWSNIRVETKLEAVNLSQNGIEICEIQVRLKIKSNYQQRWILSEIDSYAKEKKIQQRETIKIRRIVLKNRPLHVEIKYLKMRCLSQKHINLLKKISNQRPKKRIRHELKGLTPIEYWNQILSKLFKNFYMIGIYFIQSCVHSGVLVTAAVKLLNSEMNF